MDNNFLLLMLKEHGLSLSKESMELWSYVTDSLAYFRGAVMGLMINHHLPLILVNV